jgi:hypothetical protein
VKLVINLYFGISENFLENSKWPPWYTEGTGGNCSMKKTCTQKSCVRCPLRNEVFSVADPDLGSGIRCLFDHWIRDPGSGMGKKSGSGSGIRNEQTGSYFLELIETMFLG